MAQASAPAVQAHEAAKIGLIPCLAFSVGTMIGGGVFTLSGVAVDEAGPAAMLAYVIAGVVMLLSALSFAAVASRSRPGDSGYASIGTILGPQWRFLAMWAFYLNAVTCIAFVLVSFGSYLQQYFVSGLPITVAALLAVVLLGVLNLGPADLVGRAETFLVGLKVAILLLLVAYGLASLGTAQFTPFVPHGGSSVLTVTAMLFTAYTGFNVVTNMAGSVRRPERTVPLAMILSILISAVVYVGVIVALLASGEHSWATGERCWWRSPRACRRSRAPTPTCSARAS
jgi:amino acid transporter